MEEIYGMRYTTIEGEADDVNITIYGNVSLICAVMEIGKQVGPLTYEAKLNGKELLSRFHLSEENAAKIHPDNIYLMASYDW